MGQFKRFLQIHALIIPICNDESPIVSDIPAPLLNCTCTFQRMLITDGIAEQTSTLVFFNAFQSIEILRFGINVLTGGGDLYFEWSVTVSLLVALTPGQVPDR